GTGGIVVMTESPSPPPPDLKAVLEPKYGFFGVIPARDPVIAASAADAAQAAWAAWSAWVLDPCRENTLEALYMLQEANGLFTSLWVLRSLGAPTRPDTPGHLLAWLRHQRRAVGMVEAIFMSVPGWRWAKDRLTALVRVLTTSMSAGAHASPKDPG